MLSFPESRAFATTVKLDTAETGLDHYAARGAALSRDSASTVMAALGLAVYDLESRGGEANMAEAEIIRALRKNLNTALCS